MYEKRNALGLTQRQMAEVVFNNNKLSGHICKIEKGKGITLATMDQILEKLNATIEFIEN